MPRALVQQRLVEQRRLRALAIHRQERDQHQRLAAAMLQRRINLLADELLPLGRLHPGDQPVADREQHHDRHQHRRALDHLARGRQRAQHGRQHHTPSARSRLTPAARRSRSSAAARDGPVLTRNATTAPITRIASSPSRRMMSSDWRKAPKPLAGGPARSFTAGQPLLDRVHRTLGAAQVARADRAPEVREVALERRYGPGASGARRRLQWLERDVRVERVVVGLVLPAHPRRRQRRLAGASSPRAP